MTFSHPWGAGAKVGGAEGKVAGSVGKVAGPVGKVPSHPFLKVLECPDITVPPTNIQAGGV